MLMKPGATASPVASTSSRPRSRSQIADRGDAIVEDGDVAGSARGAPVPS